MHDHIYEFLKQVREVYYTEGSTEHSYRPALKQLFESLLPDMTALNERKRVEVGAPDFVLFKTPETPSQLELFRVISLGYIEAKDIRPGILDTPDNRKQIERYLDLGNVVHTDNLTWRFYFERDMVREISIAHLDESGYIIDDPAAFDELVHYLRKIVETPTPTIRTARSLALHMADRARPIRYTIQQALQADLNADAQTELSQQYEAFRETLIHDLSVQDFADIYAETIAYGLFAARYNDDTAHDFTLQEAAQRVPQTNPFLRQFFLQIAAYERDTRLNWVLSRFAELFVHADVRQIMSTYGKDTGMNHDPVTHFYETFLGEYDPKRRKARGVYYTPLPVVQYIVRAVDKVLKEEFGLADGLADDSTITFTENVAPFKKGKGTGGKVYNDETKQIPRVQILDPATGTSTFLNETIKHIYSTKGARLGNGWSNYVEENLLPRIHGFEILMAAYSMAHMRLGLTLAETGYKPSDKHPRIGVYLTNSLEEPAADDPPLLAMLGMGRALTEEAIAADRVKRDLPIMIVMGNPPYSVSSANKSKYIDKLMANYKKDLNERNIQPLSDDYIKFIRYAENLIVKNGQGIVAMITNNSYIDGLIHRQMRKHLLQSFDKIWVLDLHGSTNKNEVAQDGSKDENVFDIKQGVSIVVMVKKVGTEQTDKHAEVQFAELYGKRSDKYNALKNEQIFNHIEAAQPRYLFVTKHHSELERKYESYISIRDLMPFGDAGIKTHRDNFAIGFNAKDVYERLIALRDGLNTSEELGLKDTRDFSVKTAINFLRNLSYDEIRAGVKPVAYRPFDNRFFANFGAVADWPRHRTMTQLLDYKNYGLITSRQYGSKIHFIVGIASGSAVEISSQPFAPYNVRPLYIYHPDGTRSANFNDGQLKSLLSNIEPYCYVDSSEDLQSPQPDYVITAIDILDYIYGILHSPSYRTKYKEFLKSDFPRIPKPDSIFEFECYAEAGKKLRKLHLMQDVTPGDYSPQGEGDDTVDQVKFIIDDENDVGKVYYNPTQYFDNVPRTAWEFYIGGYQPAQKWLKDRKGRELGYKDIEHYQRIITILLETARIMKEIG